jgi:general secretion pathway protein F
MPLYFYKVVNQQGKIEQGVREAVNENKLLLELQGQGLIPIKVSISKPTSLLGFRIGVSKPKLSTKDIVKFTSELATLVESGLPLDRSLTILIQLTEDNLKLNAVALNVLERIKAGKSLADSLEMENDVFSKFYLNMIRAGEMGGDLGGVLHKLFDYLERSQALKEKVTTALIYPAVLLIMSIVSILVMLTFVVPQFRDMFESAGQALPLPTQIVVAVADAIRNDWWIVLLVVIVIWQLIKWQLANPLRKQDFDGYLLKMPLFGEIILIKEVAVFTRTLGTLLGNGVSILKSMVIVKEIIINKVLIELVDKAEMQVKEGKNLSIALAKLELFPKLAIQMIKMGEETGRLEEMLIKVADIYDKQLSNSIQRMLALLEPVLIIFLGLMIGGIIVSILLAILSVNDLAL